MTSYAGPSPLKTIWDSRSATVTATKPLIRRYLLRKVSPTHLKWALSLLESELLRRNQSVFAHSAKIRV
jgi:hypothetical protein